MERIMGKLMGKHNGKIMGKIMVKITGERRCSGTDILYYVTYQIAELHI